MKIALTLTFAVTVAAGLYVALGVLPNQSVPIHLSTRHYDGLSNLKSQSDLIVYGKVTSAAEVEYIEQPGYGPDTKDTFGFLLPLSTYTVEPIEVFQGTVQGPIRVQITGGPVQIAIAPGNVLPKATRTLVPDDAPLFEQGESHLLFLRRLRDGRYVVVGNDQGRAKVQAAQKSPQLAFKTLNAQETEKTSLSTRFELLDQKASREVREFIADLEP
jgi:hypothetical protein